MKRLTALLQRYGEAIAADLAFAGWDIVDLVEQGRWAFTLNLIDHLPRTARFRDALAQDEDLAASLLAEGLSAGSMPISEWSAEAAALAVIADRLWEVCNTIARVNGNKGAQLKPYPRPVTAFDRVRAAQRASDASAMEAKLWPAG